LKSGTPTNPAPTITIVGAFRPDDAPFPDFLGAAFEEGEEGEEEGDEEDGAGAGRDSDMMVCGRASASASERFI